MLVSLYTSRMFLQILGVMDYGIYNLVSNFVVIFSFLNSAMTSSTLRFITYYLGLERLNELRTVFSLSFQFHLIIAILVVLLAETIGLWYLNEIMSYPRDRQFATNWVFQFALFTLVVNIISAPHISLVVARERMGVFTIVGIVETLFKVIILAMLSFSKSDR